MSGPEAILVPFCMGLICLLAWIIIVPFLRGTGDLFTTKNLFLAGGINYVGIGGLQAAFAPNYFRVLEYTRNDYLNYVLGGMAFFMAFLLTYSFFKMPRKIAGSALRKWPSSKPALLYFMTFIAVGLAFFGMFAPNIQGLGQLVRQLGDKSIVFVVGLAFAAWFQSKRNPILLGTFLGVFALSMLLSVLTGGGRRTMVGVVVTIPVCWYWFSLRYKNFIANAILIGSLCTVGFLVLLGYSGLRHFEKKEGTERNISTSFEVLTKLPRVIGDTSALDQILGQNAGQIALAAIHVYTDSEDPEPFHTVKFVSSVWFPRAFWENKPLGLGYTLPKTVKAETRATWGPSIIGHGFHEGGLHMLVFYGVLMGTFLRFADELIARQPNNAYLLACLSASAGHVFGWTRGDIGTFSIQIIGSILVLLLFCYGGRMFFGTGVVYPRTSGPEFVNTNIFAFRRYKPTTPSPTDFQFRRSE